MAKSRGVMLTVLPVQVSKSPTQLCTDAWAGRSRFFGMVGDAKSPLGFLVAGLDTPMHHAPRARHGSSLPHGQGLSRTQQSACYVIWLSRPCQICCLRAYFSSQADLQTRSIRRYTHVVGHHHKFRFGKLVSQFDSSLPRPAKAGMPDATHNTYALKPAPVTSCMPMRRGQRAGLGFDPAPPPPLPPQVPLKRPGCSRPAPHERESPI